MRAPEFWSGPPGAAPARLLAPLGWAWAAGGALRQALGRPRRAPLPVVCVGAATVGGAGKTPTVIALARRLVAAGARPQILARGYGGRVRGPLRVAPGETAAAVGDEALLLAEAAPCWVCRDRLAGARAAFADGAEILLLDDGLQDPAIAKDLAILVVDGGAGFGNGRVLPAGPLREPAAWALARADAVLLIGAAEAVPAAALAAGRPLLRATLLPEADGPPIAGRRVLAFAGIGRPAKFFETVRALGAELVAARPFPDHHPYREREIAALLREAGRLRALPVTTAKDAVRLPAARRAEVAVLRVSLAWQKPAAVDRLLAPLLAARR